ncbi:tetraacyldisaccharide 4'-kinase [Ideonella lacteola]
MHALRPLAVLFQGLAALHRQSQLRQRPASVGRPVIVVGNLVVGGAGKTPTVIALIELLRRDGWRPGVVSRGYGRTNEAALVELDEHSEASDCGDEPLLIHRRTGAPVVVGRDRLAGARHLLERHPQVDVIVSDDGLQHHRLPRDVEVVVFDGRGAGNGLTLPAGPLRQPVPDSAAPHMLVVYNAAEPSTPLPGHVVRRQLAGAVALGPWWKGQQPQAVHPLSDWAGRRVLAAAGTGDPERFFRMLEEAGLTIDRLPLPDHARLTPPPWPTDTPDVFITEKDAVKLRPEAVGATRVWVVALDFALPPAFAQALRQRLPRTAHPA